jgi:hypothetical protein
MIWHRLHTPLIGALSNFRRELLTLLEGADIWIVQPNRRTSPVLYDAGAVRGKRLSTAFR